MTAFSSWRALFVREYLEHRMAVPMGPARHPGAARAVGPLGHRSQPRQGARRVPACLSALKIYEMGYLVLLALWLAYLAVALFFYFGDAFSADRRNNAMLFWKSMPVTDLKILTSKMLAGLHAVPGDHPRRRRWSAACCFYLLVNIARLCRSRASRCLGPLEALCSFVQMTLFGIVLLPAGAALVRAVLRLGRRPVDGLRPLEPAAGLRDPGPARGDREHLVLRPGPARRLHLAVHRQRWNFGSQRGRLRLMAHGRPSVQRVALSSAA